MNLYQLVEEIKGNNLQEENCFRTSTQIINDIHPGLKIVSGHELLAQTIQSLLEIKPVDSRLYYIKVTVKLFHQLVLVQLKTNLSFDYLPNEQKFRNINDLAGELGGCLYFSNDRRNEWTISYTYQQKPCYGHSKMALPVERIRPATSTKGVIRK